MPGGPLTPPGFCSPEHSLFLAAQSGGLPASAASNKSPQGLSGAQLQTSVEPWPAEGTWEVVLTQPVF